MNNNTQSFGKIKLHIPGLDKILKGGVNKTNMVLIAGAPGTGKTIAALQFIYNGAKGGIPGLFITSENTAASLRRDSCSIGFCFDELEKQGLVTIIEQPLSRGRLISLEAPLSIIKKKKIKRVALDSLSLFKYLYALDEDEFRKGVIQFIKNMKDAGVTMVVTSERQSVELDNFQFLPEDFLFDGLIIFSRVRTGSDYERVLTVAKMRGQDHLIGVYPFTIGKNGIRAFPDQMPFAFIGEEENKAGK